MDEGRAVLFWVVLACIGEVAWATPAANCVKTPWPKSFATSDSPGGNAAVTYSDTELLATASTRPTGTTLTIQRRGGAPLHVSLSSLTLRAKLIQRAQDRLIVVGALDRVTGASLVEIVDWRRGLVTDGFEAYEPSIAPDGSHVAFIRIYPSHGVDAEDQYLLYRTHASDTENRVDVPESLYLNNGLQASAVRDVGTMIYPMGAAEKWRDNIEVPDHLAHRSLSPLVWSEDGRRLAFVDQQGSAVKVVVVDIPIARGAPKTRVLRLGDPLSLCLPGFQGKGCDTTSRNAVKLQIDETAIELSTFASRDGARMRSIKLPMARFSPAKTD